MTTRPQRFVLTFALVLLLVPALHAQDSPRLRLNPGTADSQDIEVDLTEPMRISPDSGDISLFTSPRDACASSDTGSCADLIDVAIEAFTIDGTTSEVSVVQGTSIDIRYSSRGAWECDRTGLADTTWDRTGALPERTITVDTSTLQPRDDPYDVGLQCRNGPKAQSLVRALTVSEPNSPPPQTTQECINAGQVPPRNWSEQNAFLVDGSRNLVEASTWADLYLTDFPGGSLEARLVNRPLQYMVVEFNTGNFTNDFGFPNESSEFSTQPPDGLFPSGVEAGTMLIKISQCPGDFTPPEDPGCRAKADSLRWKKDDGVASSSRCNLAENTKYFLNMAFVADTSADEPVWQCNGGTSNDCGVQLTP